MRTFKSAMLALAVLAPQPLFANSGPLFVAEISEQTSADIRADCEDIPFLDPTFGSLNAPDDLTACFQVLYDVVEQILTITAMVEDDVRITERSAKRLPNGLGQNPDGVLVYLDLLHRSTYAEKIELSLVSRPIAAVDDRLLPEGIVSIDRTYLSPRLTRYDWTIDLPALMREQGVSEGWLASGAVLFGFDVVVFDRDSETDGAILKWTKGSNDGAENRDLGDLLIWPEAPELVSVGGNTGWNVAGREASPPRFVHFNSSAFPHVTFRALTDPSGGFSIKLPKGRYRAAASDSRSNLQQSTKQLLSIDDDGAQPALHLVGTLPVQPFENVVQSLMQEHEVRTVGLGWIHEGQRRILQTFGHEADGDIANAQTVFRTASITKLITTMTVMELVANDAWDLDQPLAEYWVEPDLAGDPRYAHVTTRMVLRHLAGLPNWREGSALEFESDPGVQQGYSGEAFEILRRALEHATDRSLESLAQGYVLRPAKMENTSLRWSPFAADQFAGEYWGTGTAVSHYRGDRVNAAANLLSTPHDLLNFAEWFMDWRERHPELARLLEKPNGASLMPDGVTDWSPNGLGWFVQDRDGIIVLEHSGGQRGINTHLLVIPETRSALVVLTNSSAGWPIVRAAFQATLNADGDLSGTLERLYGDIRF